jgi:putative hydrolase of the HAD superfamily
MIKAIFFDLDGVLTSDSTGTTSIVNYISQCTELDSIKFESAYRKHNYELLYGIKVHTEIWSEICEDYGEEINIEILYDSFRATPIDTQMVKLVKELKEIGYVLGVITDNKQDRIDHIYEYNDFDNLFSYTTVSSELGSGKKEKYIFEKMLDKSRFSAKECVFIDNNKQNLIWPEKLGMYNLHFDDKERNTYKLKGDLRKLGIKVNTDY